MDRAQILESVGLTPDDFSPMCWARVKKAMDAAYLEGKREGITLFAWWKDGVEYVGTCGTTLKKALEEVTG